MEVSLVDLILKGIINCFNGVEVSIWWDPLLSNLSRSTGRIKEISLINWLINSFWFDSKKFLVPSGVKRTDPKNESVNL